MCTSWRLFPLLDSEDGIASKCLVQSTWHEMFQLYVSLVRIRAEQMFPWNGRKFRLVSAVRDRCYTKTRLSTCGIYSTVSDVSRKFLSTSCHVEDQIGRILQRRQKLIIWNWQWSRPTSGMQLHNSVSTVNLYNIKLSTLAVKELEAASSERSFISLGGFKLLWSRLDFL